jgi:hypothetical protein
LPACWDRARFFDFVYRTSRFEFRRWEHPIRRGTQEGILYEDLYVQNYWKEMRSATVFTYIKEFKNGKLVQLFVQDKKSARF